MRWMHQNWSVVVLLEKWASEPKKHTGDSDDDDEGR
jgi:hypothetical protein